MNTNISIIIVALAAAARVAAATEFSIQTAAGGWTTPSGIVSYSNETVSVQMHPRAGFRALGLCVGTNFTVSRHTDRQFTSTTNYSGVLRVDEAGSLSVTGAAGPGPMWPVFEPLTGSTNTESVVEASFSNCEGVFYQIANETKTVVLGSGMPSHMRLCGLTLRFNSGSQSRTDEWPCAVKIEATLGDFVVTGLDAYNSETVEGFPPGRLFHELWCYAPPVAPGSTATLRLTAWAGPWYLAVENTTVVSHWYDTRTVVPARIQARMVPALVIEGACGLVSLQACADLNSGIWSEVSRLVITNSPFIWFDGLGDRPQRFYRVVQ